MDGKDNFVCCIFVCCIKDATLFIVRLIKMCFDNKKHNGISPKEKLGSFILDPQNTGSQLNCLAN